MELIKSLSFFTIKNETPRINFTKMVKDTYSKNVSSDEKHIKDNTNNGKIFCVHRLENYY